MFDIPLDTINGLSNERPQATAYTSSSYPKLFRISGLNIPLLPISIHLLRPSWNANISKLGAV